MDDDEKVRRNLVVFSAAVLITDYLGVSFSSLATEILKSHHANLDSNRILTLALLILIYLAARYRFSEEGAKYKRTMDEEWQQLCYARVQKWCQRSLMLYFKYHAEISGIFSAKLPDILRTLSGPAYRANGGSFPAVREVIVGMSSAGPTPWIYQAFVQFTWGIASQGEDRKTNGLVDVRFSGFPLAALKLITTLEAWFYSKGSINSMIPAILGNAAAIVLLAKVINLGGHL